MEQRSLSSEEFLKIVRPRFRSDEAARAWFEDEPLPGFGGATAQQLVFGGRAAHVLDYIAAVDAGVYA
jgi:hypothetical protein